MNWIILIIAGLCETGFAFCLGKMKGLEGTVWWLWGAGFLVMLTLSMILLAKAVQTIPIGTAYPVWTGIGAVGTVIAGIVFFHEPATFWRMFFITTLIISIADLKWYTDGAKDEKIQTADPCGREYVYSASQYMRWAGRGRKRYDA